MFAKSLYLKIKKKKKKKKTNPKSMSFSTINNLLCFIRAHSTQKVLNCTMLLQRDSLLYFSMSFLKNDISDN
jgi:hypothetical protein